MQALDYDSEPPPPRKWWGLTGLEWLVGLGVVGLLVSILIVAFIPERHGSGADYIEKARKARPALPATQNK